MRRKNKNVQAFMFLRMLGFPAQNIRKILAVLTGISNADAARSIGCSRAYTALAMSGIRTSQKLQKAMARIYEIPAGVLFEGIENDKPRKGDE